MEGFVEIYSKTEAGLTKLAEFQNTILNSGYDVMTKALTGDSENMINGMYVEFFNGTPAEPTIPLDRTPEYYYNLTNPYGFVKFKTVFTPAFSSSDSSKYRNNVVTFIGEAPATSSGGAPIIDGTSQFYTVALASIPSLDDYARDQLVSAASIKVSGSFTPLMKVANAQLLFKWSLKLGA